VLRPCTNPLLLAKAQKNSVEIEGMRRAHLLDGVAVTRFLCWLDTLEGTVDELQIAERLESFRRAHEEYRGASFATIAGSGAHGAIVHYRADAASTRALEEGEVLLLDSGGQYLCGTTDITRTLVRGGQAGAEFRDRFTRVLKGHIALVQAQFPAGTHGTQLDVLARQPLWDAGLDYDHGTGHGVGAYLCVHEGPQRISKRGGDVPLVPGMILSNEPGYYREGEYGIRIENLVLVVEREKIEGRLFLGFSTLTLAPIDVRLLEPKLLTASDRAWLNHYHGRVMEALSPHLDGFEREWLAAYCRAV
jgi:Xaa-Pro aminopeptidase